ncbi:hypothetical protein DKP78_16845, partial [Enterococcus faecium]
MSHLYQVHHSDYVFVKHSHNMYCLFIMALSILYRYCVVVESANGIGFESYISQNKTAKFELRVSIILVLGQTRVLRRNPSVRFIS